jgi:hypothetical protein
MTEVEPSSRNPLLRAAVRISVPFWIFAIVFFYPVNSASPHSGTFFFGLLYVIILLPGVLLALLVNSAFAADPTVSAPWPLLLLTLLIGQFLGVYAFLSVRVALRRRHKRAA